MARMVFVLLFLSTPALANSIITIGAFTYLGPNSQGLSQYQAVLNTNGVTAEPFTFIGYGFGENGGGVCCPSIPTTAGPITITVTFGRCPCSSFSFTLLLPGSPNKPFTFLLANGQLFTAYSVDTSTVLPLPGRSSIEPGQSVPVQITAVPEPGTALLIASGLTCFVGRRWRAGRAASS